ncbi:alpha-L-fucosidase [Allorhizocola rhizosphaerae]|uniref:alpha-L-fucosidase n=1 Tax=Allorhizocola rhizosphaerae TaxID=1872709 RepID=UPI000E3C5615|nr:alpha-L-fucosidase [Allorhizocola rhizosphaerae]
MPMQPWFAEAKLGIFIHWGIYAVDGTLESWAFQLGEVPYDEYMKQLNGFTAEHYDPREWAELFARVGARYAVLTSRHHDGVALWPNGLSVGQDLLSGYADALREHGLKVGFYYSHSDWSRPDYAEISHEEPYVKVIQPLAPGFLSYRDGQVDELMRRYKPDLMWFDGEWEHPESEWGLDKLAALMLAHNPEVVFNGRMLSHGDYATPEQGVPITAPDGPWELCLTLNESWGYRHGDTNYKSVRQIVRYFAETIGMGGNLLLDIGPRADGTIPPEQVSLLEGLGAWIAKHSEAVYGTVAGLPHGHHYGPSTLSADRSTLNLILFDTPRETVSVRGVRNKVRRAHVNGIELGHRVTGGLGEVPGVLWIDAPPAHALDDYATVLTVELDGPLDLYRGTGRN